MLVFVYGSLKRNSVNADLMSAAVLIDAAATTSDAIYEMVSFGLFPGVRLGGQWKIHGEVYEIDRALRDRLDEIENHPRDYRRQLVAVDGLKDRAWMYLINDHAVDGAVDDDPHVVTDRRRRTQRWEESI